MDKSVRCALSRLLFLLFFLLSRAAIEDLNDGQLFAEVSIVFSSCGALKALTRRAYFLVLLLLLARLVFRESYTQEYRVISSESQTGALHLAS